MNRLVSLLIGAMIACLIPSLAHAFCVYNKTDTAQQVSQWSGGRSMHMMSVNIAPGKSACCNFASEDCNSNKSPTSTVSFATSSSPSYIHSNVFCGNPPNVSGFAKAFGAAPSKSWSMSASGWANIILATPSRPSSDFKGRIYIIDIYDSGGNFKGLYDCYQ